MKFLEHLFLETFSENLFQGHYGTLLQGHYGHCVMKLPQLYFFLLVRLVQHRIPCYGTYRARRCGNIICGTILIIAFKKTDKYQNLSDIVASLHMNRIVKRRGFYSTRNAYFYLR